jgi:hypothetical protein
MRLSRLSRRVGVARVLACACSVLGACALLGACGVEETKYVGPEALRGKEPPPPSVPITGAGVPEGGAPGALCNGAGPVDGGPCAKSWKTDIYEPLIKGAWKCTNEICHLEGNENQAAYQPAMSDKDATRAWNQLVAYSVTSKRYVDPCTTDPAVSAITCNLVSPACGLAQMPYTGLGLQGVTNATPDQLAVVATWLQCGAPNN